MFDEAFPDETAVAVDTPASHAPDLKKPGALGNFLTATGDAIPAGTFEALRALNYLSDKFNPAGGPQFEGVPTIEDWRKVKKLGDQSFRHEIDYYTPNPAVTGAASNFLFQATKGISKAVGYGALAGPAAGALAFGTDTGINKSLELQDQSVDEATSNKAGLISGAISAATVGMPVAGRTLGETAGLALLGGPGGYMAETAAINHVLDNADYHDISRQYDPFDVTQLILSALPPAAMGAFAHAIRPKAEARSVASPTEAIDAAQAVNDAIRINTSALTKPGDIERISKHVDALENTKAQIDRGEQVSVPPDVADPEVTSKVRDDMSVRVPNDLRGVTDQMQATSDKLAKFVQKSVDNPIDNNGFTVLGDVDAPKRDLIAEHTGIDVGDAKTQLRADIVRNSQDGHPDLTHDDWRMLPWLMHNFEDVHLLEPQGNDKGPRMALIARDPVSGYAYVAEAMAGKKPGDQLAVVNFFKDHPGTIGNWLETNGRQDATVTGASHDQIPPEVSPGQIPEPSTGAGHSTLTPEIRQAQEIIAQRDYAIHTLASDPDGIPVTRSLRDMMGEADAEAAQAKTESKAFDAAVQCFLRTGL